jgi:phage N-6-adenine-methyltransferase
MTKVFLDTPKDWFAMLDREFNFTLDVAASKENALCDNYFTEEDNALEQDWGFHTVWCSAVWTDPECYEWVKKGYYAARDGATVVMLLPVRTHEKWWHEFVLEAESIRFLTGKLHFPVPKGMMTYHVEEHCLVIFDKTWKPPWVSSYPHSVI